LSFPAGKHDDQVDALGLIGQLLDQMVPGQKPSQPEKPKVDSGYRLSDWWSGHSIGLSSKFWSIEPSRPKANLNHRFEREKLAAFFWFLSATNQL
jgi:hypothetical protein